MASEVVGVARALTEIGVAEVVLMANTVVVVVEGGVEDPAVRHEFLVSFRVALIYSSYLTGGFSEHRGAAPAATTA